MVHYVHSSLIYSSQMSFNREMGKKKNVVHLHNVYIKFLGKWMELENITLSEVTQSQMNAHSVHSLISGC